MGYPLSISLRYIGSKKRAFVLLGTIFATIGVALGVAALVIVMSVTGGFKEQFRDKVLGVNAHVLVLKYSIDFREYREVMKKVERVPGVSAAAPFIINPMMVNHGERTATGVLLKGIDPEQTLKVLALPNHIVEGSLAGLRRAGAKPPEKPVDRLGAFDTPLDSPAPDAPKKSPLGILHDAPAPSAPSPFDPLPAPSASAPEPTPTKPSKDAPAAPAVPSGNVAPAGGYTSELPQDDALPDSINPDPCKNNDLVAALPGLVLGRSLAKQLAVGLGDCVQITSPTVGIAFGASGAMRSPIAKQFRVTAIFEAGFDQYDSKLVYTDIYEAEAFYDQGDSVTGVEMKVDDIDRAKDIAREVDVALGNGVYHTMDWHELNHGLFTALLIQQIGMSFVLALIIVVAAFTVIATLIMIVLEKRREIALLKAIGAPDRAILRIFLYQGGIMGVIGTGLGLLVGYGGCRALASYRFPLDPKVYFISTLPVNIRPQEFLVTGGIAVIICLLATIAPALYAAWQRPSDGLRAD